MYGEDYSDPTNEDPQAWLATIDEMVESEEYQYAEETLLGIGERIEETGRVTSGQIEAITNIQQKPSYVKRH